MFKVIHQRAPRWRSHDAYDCLITYGIQWQSQNNKTRHTASTSMYSLTFRVRVMLSYQRNPCTDCKFAQ